MLIYLVSFLSGSILTLAFAPFAYKALAIISLMAFLKINDSAKNPRDAFKLGYFFGCGFFITSIYWIYVTLFYYGHFHFVLATIITILLTAVLGVFPAVNSYLLKKLNTGRSLHYLIIFPGIWVLLEWIRSWFLSGFPWQLLAQISLDTPFEFYLPVIGTYGTGFLICLMSGAIYKSILSKRNKMGYFLLVVIMLLPGILFEDVNWTKASGAPVEVSTIQFNIEPDDKMYFLYNDEFHEHILEKTFSQPRGSIVVWPESAIMMPYQNMPEYFNTLQKMCNDNDITLVTGVTSSINGIDNNSLMVIDRKEKQVYGKSKLVPMGDYIPLTETINNVFPNSGLPMSTFKPAPQQKSIITAKGMPFLPAICFEIIFPEIVRANIIGQNPAFIINISEDGWFRKSSQPYQHLEISRLRAIENGRPLIRATNRGISAIINQHGKIIAQSNLFEQDELLSSITPVEGSTPYMLIGAFPILSIIFLLMVLAIRKSTYP